MGQVLPTFSENVPPLLVELPDTDTGVLLFLCKFFLWLDDRQRRARRACERKTAQDRRDAVPAVQAVQATTKRAAVVAAAAAAAYCEELGGELLSHGSLVSSFESL